MKNVASLLTSKTLNHNNRIVYSGFCTRCGKLFYTLGSNHSSRCSKLCSLRGTGRHVDGGYVRISTYRKDGVRGDKLEHRYVVEKFLGRKLRKKEKVHHINHNKLDNRIGNLLVVTTQENSYLNGNTVSRILGFVEPEIIQQITAEELFEGDKK